MSKASARKRESNLYVRQAAKGSLSKGWKKKYVIIRQNKGSSGKSVLLELYIEKGAHNKPVISLLLENVDSITRIPSKLREHAFEIKSGEKNLFCVSTESEIEAYEWMDVFYQHLLEPKKELGKLPEIEDDFCKVSVIPNKDSQRLGLEGDYYTVVSNMKVALYDPYTGQIKIQWDMHHLKKVLVTTKCHFRDKERIMHFCVSSRSEHGKAELHFFCLKARRLADAIFEVLSGNISITSKTTRSASMIFEISSKDLKKMMKNKDPESESVASLAMDEPHKEEPAGISVQTIPEEMDPAEDKDLQKEIDVTKTSENEDKQEKIEQNGVQVNGEQGPDQVNGHAMKANAENDKVNGEATEPQQGSENSEEKVPDSSANKEPSDEKTEDKAVNDGDEKDTTVESKESTEHERQTETQNETPNEQGESQTALEPETVPSITIDSDNVPTSSDSKSANEESPSPADSKEVGDVKEVSEVPGEEQSNYNESQKELNQVNTDNTVEGGNVCQDASETLPEHSEDSKSPQETSEAVPEHSEDTKSPQETTDQVTSTDDVNNKESEQSKDSTEPVNSSESADPINSSESVEPTKTTDSTEPTNDLPEPTNSTDSAEPAKATASAKLTNSTDSAEAPSPSDSAEAIKSTDSAEQTNSTDSPAEPQNSTDSTEPSNDSKPDNQTLPHDTSTDSGFINDSTEPGASINTNNNNSRESLNEGHCLGVEEANVLPEYGLPVDVADLEDFSVIVYSQESPEKLV